MKQERDAICVLPHRRDPDRSRRAALGVRVCLGHLKALHREIAELPALYEDLLRAHTISATTQSKVSGTKSPRVPVREEVAEARAAILGRLAFWVEDVADKRGLTYPVRNVFALAVWLDQHVDWIANHDMVTNVAVELAETYALGWRLAYPSGRRRIVVGECVELVACDVATRALLRCPGTLVAFVARTDDLLPSAVQCDTDESHCWSADRWLLLGRRVHGAA